MQHFLVELKTTPKREKLQFQRLIQLQLAKRKRKSQKCLRIKALL